MEYLLSDGDPSTLATLPIVPSVTGDFLTLHDPTSGAPIHDMLSEDEEPVFRRFAQSAVSLSKIPIPARNVLITKGSACLNVSRLNVDSVIQYISKAIGTDVRMHTDEDRDWIITFWEWLPTWRLCDPLLERISHLKLIPTTEGTMESVQSIVFDPRNLDQSTISVLTKAGIVFLSRSFPSQASVLIAKRGTLVSPEQLSILCEHLQPRKVEDLAQTERLSLLRHLLFCARQSSPLGRNRQVLLCALPIFPVLAVARGPSTPTTMCSLTKLTQIPNSTTIYGINPDVMGVLGGPSGVFLPTLPGLTFIAYRFNDIDISSLLELVSDNPKGLKLTELDVIQLFIDNLPSLPKLSISTFLERLVGHSSSIPPRIFDSISGIKFLSNSQLILESPKDLIDPYGPLRKLFHSDDRHLPSISDDLDHQILHHLSKLRLLRRHLAPDLVIERLSYLSNPSSSDVTGLAIELLHQLNSTGFNCTPIAGAFSSRWLPTNEGLKSPQETRDDHDRHPRALFDRVWPLLLPGIVISSGSLRSTLGWNTRIPFEIIQQQIERELEHGTAPSTCSRLEVIVGELGRRVGELQDHPVLHSLKDSLGSKLWIPTNEGTLCSTSRAVVNTRVAIPPGFHPVSITLIAGPGVRNLLILLGCTET